MRRITVFSFLVAQSLGNASCGGDAITEQRPTEPTIQQHFVDVRARFSGDSAREIVASMEGTFRLPGNTGFDASIARVVETLHAAGYVAEEEAEAGAPLTYRVERRAMEAPTWEPVSGSLELVGPGGGPLPPRAGWITSR